MKKYRIDYGRRVSFRVFLVSLVLVYIPAALQLATASVMKRNGAVFYPYTALYNIFTGNSGANTVYENIAALCMIWLPAAFVVNFIALNVGMTSAFSRDDDEDENTARHITFFNFAFLFQLIALPVISGTLLFNAAAVIVMGITHSLRNASVSGPDLTVRTLKHITAVCGYSLFTVFTYNVWFDGPGKRLAEKEYRRINNSGDTKRLRKNALSYSDRALRIASLDKLDDEELWRKALDDSSSKVRLRALKRLNESGLWDNAAEDTSPEVRAEAAKHITDPEKLISIYLRTEPHDLDRAEKLISCYAALGRSKSIKHVSIPHTDHRDRSHLYHDDLRDDSGVADHSDIIKHTDNGHDDHYEVE